MNGNLNIDNLTCAFYPNEDNNILAVYDNGKGVASVTYTKPYYISLMRFFHDEAFVEIRRELEESYKQLKEDLEKYTNRKWSERDIDDLIDHCKYEEV